VRIVQITDRHLNPDEHHPNGVDVQDNARWALREAQDREPDLIVLTGDLAFWMGTHETYREVAALLDGISSDYLVLPGNHDDRSLFSDVFGRRYRTTPDHPWLDRQVNLAGIPMILLDSADGTIAEGQLAWLEVVIAEYARAAGRGEAASRIILWTHHPILTGFHRYMDREYPLVNATEVYDGLLAAIATDRLEVTIFCGHYHTENAQQRGPISQYCTPSTYLQIDPRAEEFRVAHRTPGIRLVDIGGGGTIATSVVYRDSGEHR
jgi:Icc protein